MTCNDIFYCFALLLLTITSSRGQEVAATRLSEEVRLQERGQNMESVQVLTLFLHNHQPSSPEQEGVALDALGSAYQDLGQYDEARHSYDQAILILQSLGSSKLQYAEALDDLGSLELFVGNLKESRSLRKRAYTLYAQMNSHSGLCLAANNLAVIAFDEGKLKEADEYLTKAFQQSSSATDLTDDDLASMYNLRGRLAEKHRDFATAVSAQREALRLWLLTYSPSYYKIAIGYTALGSAEAGGGDVKQAFLDLKHALSLEEDSRSSRNSRTYLQTILAYAQVLKLSGNSKDAALLEADARAKLLQVRIPNATVSAESLAREHP